MTIAILPSLLMSLESKNHKIVTIDTEISKFSKMYQCILCILLAALAQMVACLPLVQQVRDSIPGGVVNFHLKIFNLGARRGGDVHFLITRLCITGLD